MRSDNTSLAAYKRAETLRQKQDMTIDEVCKKLGITKSSYNYGRKCALRGEVAAKPAVVRHETIQLKPSHRIDGRVPVLLCTPEQVRELFQ
jgi:hypothetical protein